MKLRLNSSLSLEELRYIHREWSWRALRSGFGWRYEGCRGDRCVGFSARSVLCEEDEYVTRWFNDQGEDYVTWSCRELGQGK